MLSISQFCDKGFKVIFEKSLCIVTSPIDNNVKLIGHRHGNIYMVDLDDLPIKDGQCLVATSSKSIETSWLWHRRLGHASMYLISKLIRKDLVRDLPKLNFEKDKVNVILKKHVKSLPQGNDGVQNISIFNESLLLRQNAIVKMRAKPSGQGKGKHLIGGSQTSDRSPIFNFIFNIPFMNTF